MASKYLDYLMGYDKLILTREMIHADWGNNSRAIEFTNFALNLYYRARKNVREFVPKDKKSTKLKVRTSDPLV